MRFLLPLLLMAVYLLGTGAAHAQTLYPSTSKVQVNNLEGERIEAPFTGGFLKPQFQNIDLNRDGIKDLLVLDLAASSGGESILTYLGNGERFVYAPSYRQYLPPHLYDWIQVVDMTGDGRLDLVTNGNAFVENPILSFASRMFIYRDVSTGNEPPRYKRAFTDSFGAFYDDPIGERLTYLTTRASFDRPLIRDLDGDGDYDFLGFTGRESSRLQGIYNRSIEETGKADTLILQQYTGCWGRFEESVFSAELRSVYCDELADTRREKNAALHTGSGLGGLDYDGDGDLDLLLSDTGLDSFTFLVNGRVEEGLDHDSIIAFRNDFPPGATQVDLPTCPAAYNVDCDFDGDQDLLVAPYEPEGNLEQYKTLDQIWWYENTGSDASPSFELRTRSFLQERSLDFGFMARPLAHDFNQDGTLEILVAHAGDRNLTETQTDRLALLQTQSRGDTVLYQLVDDNFLQLREDSLQQLVPTAGDLNGDGKADLLLGNAQGRLIYFENTSSQSDLAFTRTNIGINVIDVGTSASPCLYDLNQDGKLDILVGTARGAIRYYRNTGTVNTPAFQLESDTLGRILAAPEWNDSLYTILNTAAHPTVADLNNDGTDELLVGNEYGQVIRYTIRPEALNQAWEGKAVDYTSPLDSSLHRIAVGGMASPTVGFIDSDTLPDLLVGSERGGLMLFSTNYAAPILTDTGVKPVPEQTEEASLRLYPNPTQSQFYLEPEKGELISSEAVHVSIYSPLGQRVQAHRFAPDQNRLVLSLEGRPSGIYFVQVRTSSGRNLGRFRVVHHH